MSRFGITANAETILAEIWINPVDGIITSSYGNRINPVLNKEEFHDGIDIAVESGTEVYAVKSGIVTRAEKSLTYGNTLYYETNDGYTIMYAHLQEAIAVEGEKIRQGQAIALSGNTGLTTGPHLHYTVWKNSEKLDPFAFVVLPYTTAVAMEYDERGEKIPLTK